MSCNDDKTYEPCSCGCGGSSDCNCDCNECAPVNCIEQAINDALATKEEQLEELVDRAEDAAEKSEAGAAASAASAAESKGYRDEAEVAATTATDAMGTVVGVAEALEDTANKLKQIADELGTAIAGISVVTWYYTAVSDNQKVIPVPAEKNQVDVQAIFIEGARQEPNRGFTYDALNKEITLAEGIPLGMEISIIIGTYSDNPNDFANTLASDNGASLVGTSSGNTVQEELNQIETALGNVDGTLRADLSQAYGAALIGSFASVAALKAFANTQLFKAGDRVVVRSFLAGYDVGGGTFQWYPAATTADDGFSVIQPTSVTGAGRWINIKRGRLLPEECGCVPNDTSFDNGAALNKWASQRHCIGSIGKFYKTTPTIFTATTYPVHVECPSMQLVTTVANVNGVELPSDATRRINIRGLQSFAADGLNVTDRNKANGFYIANSQEVTLEDIRCEGWRNAGIWWFGVNNMTIDGFVGWRNDWDNTALFSSGGDLVEWTSSAGLAKSCSITNFLCLSDGSQSISVNSLAYGRNIVISNGRCFTYSATEFTSKAQADIKARHGITIGYNSNQTYGGGIKVSDVIIRDKGWTGIYRSGGLDGAVRYQPATISNVSVYDCGFGVNQDNIGAGILFGDVVDGDMINDCYVEGFANANNGAYKIQDSMGTGKLTLANCVDRNSSGYGVHIATESVNVMVLGHRSIDPAGANIFLEAKSGATLFRSHTIDGCRLERVTDGYGIVLTNGVLSANIKNNELRGTPTVAATNSGIYIAQNGQVVNIRGNQFYGFGYGIWYNTYVNADTVFPWGNNQFFGCTNAHRLARSTGTSTAKVEPNFYDGGTPNRFSNGGAGTVNGTEEFRVNGVPVT